MRFASHRAVGECRDEGALHSPTNRYSDVAWNG
jgi:hypothetical protein